jgi:amino acid adenylation domain-containing protein
MGDKSRLIQCSEILLQKGHQICGVISSNPSILRWAKEKNLPQISPNADIVGLLKQEPFDLFFSIDNLFKVPNEILTLPRIYAINFHDAPLPRFAGNNATNWALMNRQTTHGITWHVMTNVIDAGDILKQKIFPISDEETALTLNAKCYEKSIEGFAELMDELAEKRVKLIEQDLGKRTFFPLWKRPPAACVVDWSRSAEEIDAFSRGLDFGSYPNPLGLPKLFLGDQAIIVKQIQVLKSKPAVTPGTITLVTNQTIHVATGTQEVALSNFVSFNGEALSPSVFLLKSGLHEGDKLPELKDEFADTITRINSAHCKHEEYWIKRLACLEPIEIPYAKRSTLTDGKPRYSEARFSTSTRSMASGEISDNRGDFLLSTLVLYLSRIGGKESYDVNYRDAALQQELSNTEIFFASHVPLHIEVEYEQRVEQFHRKVQEQIKSVRAHRSYARDLVFRDPGLRDKFNGEFSGRVSVALERMESLSGYQAKCDADLLIVIPDDGKELVWLYDEKVLDKTAIDRMWKQFEVLLNDIAIGKDQLIGKLSILPEQESRKLFIEWNDTGRKYPQDVCLHQLFEAQVERTPEAVAVVFEGKQLSYQELNNRANQLAHYLQGLGVGPDALVGLFMERSLEMVIGMYGILKAGGAYVPLDPEYPPERLAYMLKEARVPVLLTQKHLLASLPENEAKVICLDSDWSTVANKSSDNLVNKTKAENLAYVIYTSGSTGTPKGVMNIHRGICNRLLWMQEAYHPTEADRVLQKTPFSFDVSVWEFFWPLLVGARLIVARPGGHKDSNYLVKVIQREEVTTIHFVPSMLQVFLEEKGVERCHSLKRVICSGEALPYELQERFFTKLGAELHNLYGPTEAAVDVTYWACKQKSEHNIVPIGYPVANTQIYILDPRLQPVPIGVPGELHIGGIQVARGYLNRPELTAEKFIPDPFSHEPGARLYKTGDLARYLLGGEIEYLGRIDHQVKVRGLRIELGEIEAVLSEHKAVSQAVIVVRESRAHDKQLMAYFVLEPDQDVTVTELRKHLRTRLPEYMIPQHFVKLDALPLTPNGKVDRRALPAPQEDRQTDESYVAPQNEVEKTIAGIWQELLNIKTVGIHDNFFELGGHSLLLVKMLVKLQEFSKKEFSIVEMFRHPTISALASFLTQKEKKETSLEKAFDLAQRQKESLRRQKRAAAARRNMNGQR